MTVNITELIKSIENLFADSVKLKIEKGHNIWILTTEGCSEALNWVRNYPEKVNAIHWFGDFYLFLSIKIIIEKVHNKKTIVPQEFCVSLSVFQGENYNNEKCQLFRAEWDGYNDENQQHAQPHWHITSSQAMENSFVKYTDTFEKQEFIELLQSEKQKVFDVKKIHFAMNGDWQNNKNHINKIENEQQVVNWLQGVLTHIRTELNTC